MASTLEVECQICESKQCLIDTQSRRFSNLVPKLEEIINSQEQHRNWLRFMCLPCKGKLDNCWKFQNLCKTAYRKFLDNFEEIAYIDVKDESDVDNGMDNKNDRILTSKETSTTPDCRDEKQMITNPIIRKVRIAKSLRGMTPKKQPRGPLPTLPDYLANALMQLPTVPMMKSNHPAHKKNATEEKTETPQKEKDTKIPATLEKVEEPESKPTTQLPEKPPVQPTKSKSHECSLCNRIFRSRNTIRQHIKEVHQKYVKAVCDICGKGFSRSQTHMNHMETHNENRSRFSCAICNKEFTIRENLKRHLIGIHIDRSKRQRCKRRCKHCRALFRTTEEYIEHLKAEHPVPRGKLLRFSYAKHSRVRARAYKSRKCRYCSKECTTLQGLEVHERIHTGEKPFACEICAKTFRQDQHLKTHMNVHTGKNRFTCEYCEKVFTQAGNLRVHRRVHTEEKPYECSTCSQRFPEQKMWKKHSAKCSEES